MGSKETTVGSQAADGHRLLAEGRLEAALRAFEDVVVAQPGFVPARFGRLLALIGLGDVAGSLAEVRALIRLLERRGDGERIPELWDLVLDAFPGAANALRSAGTLAHGRPAARRGPSPRPPLRPRRARLRAK